MEPMENIKLILTKNMKVLRKNLRINQEELAEKANLSISFLKDVERGASWVSPESLEAIAKGLEVEVGDLFNTKGIEVPPYQPIKGKTVELINELSYRLGKIPEEVIALAQDFDASHKVWKTVKVVMEDEIEEMEKAKMKERRQG